MLSPRRSFGICVYNGKVYAIGGNDGTRDLNTVEVYDPQTNLWAYVAPMIHRRMFCSAVVVSGKIIVIGILPFFSISLSFLGGVNNGTTLDCGECYDPTTNEWTMLDPPLPSPVRDIGLSFCLYLAFLRCVAVV